MGALAPLLAALLAGCSSGDAAAGGERQGDLYDGSRADRDAPDGGEALAVWPAQFTEEGQPLRLLRDGDPLDLWQAPQGGRVVLISAQVANMTTDTANLRVRVRRKDTGAILATESRTVAMVPVDGEPGRKQPNLLSRSQAAHVPLCPDYDPFDVVDRPLRVELEVTALYTDPPEIGRAAVELVPSCDGAMVIDQPLCRCECRADYFLGKCGADAATDARVARGAPSVDGAADASASLPDTGAPIPAEAPRYGRRAHP